MTTNETPRDDAPATGSNSTHGRRRFVQLSGSAIAVGLAGCSSLGIGADSEDEETPDDDAPGSTPANQGNETEESTATETEVDDSDANDSEGSTETEEDVHEHGYLYIEIDGERQPFTDPKYYQPGEHEDAAATDRFHFHDDGHDYLWHMHGQRLTLAAALGELPDIAYESADGAHVLHFDGDTYEDGDGTSVEIRRGDEEIDPSGYELQDGDEIWIEITTGDGS